MTVRISHIISFGLIICLIMPKFNFIAIPGYHQGLRYDDIFLFIGLLYIIFHQKINLYIFPGGSSYFVFFGIIILYGIFSSYEHGSISFILALRWIEYSIFFMLLFYSSLNIESLRKFIIFYIIINSIVVVFQHYGIIGGIHSKGYIELSGRYSGITGGSWELPIIISLFTIPIMNDYSLNTIKKILFIIISTFLIYNSGSRTAMIGYLFICFTTFFLNSKISLDKIILFVVLCTAFFHNTRPDYYNKIGNIVIDGSLVHRIKAWIIHYSQMQYDDYIWGMGLGATGLYVDGMFAKIFFDMGIFGIFLFCAYYYSFLNSFKLIGIVVVIFSITLDLFTASKIMYSLYLSVYYLMLIRNSQFRSFQK